VALVLVSLLLSENAYAGGDGAFIAKGQPSPIDGYVIDQNTANKVRQTALENVDLKVQVDSLNKSVDLQKKIADIDAAKLKDYATANNDLSKAVQDERSSSMWGKAIFFGLGFLSVIGGAYAIRATTK
jgi:hypothetical protein